MAFKKPQHLPFSQNLAAVVVIRIGFGPQARLVDRRTGGTVEHGNRRGMHKPSHTGVIGLLQQSSRTDDIDLFQLLPMAAALVVIPKKRRAVKHRIAALQRRREGIHISHVPHHLLHARHIAELLRTLGRRAHQRLHRITPCDQLPYQVVAQQAGGTGHKGAAQAIGVRVHTGHSIC